MSNVFLFSALLDAKKLGAVKYVLPLRNLFKASAVKKPDLFLLFMSLNFIFSPHITQYINTFSLGLKIFIIIIIIIQPGLMSHC